MIWGPINVVIAVFFFLKQNLKEFTILAFSCRLLSCCHHFYVNNLRLISVFRGICNVMKPCFHKTSFFADHLFLTASYFWHIATATSACKTEVSTKIMVRDVACFDDDQIMLSSCYNLQGAYWGWHSELVWLIFPVYLAMWLLLASQWQWWMYAFILMFIDDDDFNKGCLLVIIYKVLIQNWCDVPSMSCHVAAGYVIMI